MAAVDRWPVTFTGWPPFAETWFGGDGTAYPTGRGRERPLRGWVCSGCGHGFGPQVRECPHCPQAQPAFIAKAAPAEITDEEYER
jgi:hypothetical protein